MKTIYDLDVFGKIDKLQGINYEVMKEDEELGIERIKTRSATSVLSDEEIFNTLKPELAKNDITLLSYESDENSRTLTYQYKDDLEITPYAQPRATTEVGTTDAYTKLVCDWSNVLVNNAQGNPISRFNYGFRIRITAYGRWYGTWYFSFHTNNHSAYADVNMPSGGYSGTIVTGTLDLGWGSTQSITHTPGFAMELPQNVSGSGGIKSTLTLPLPDLTVTLESVSHNSVSFNIQLTNKYNFYKVYFVNQGIKVISKNAPNGINVDVGLTPETTYEYCFEAWNKTETESFKRQVIIHVTTTADQATMRLKIDGVWKKGKVYIKVNNVWKKAKNIYKKENARWLKGN